MRSSFRLLKKYIWQTSVVGSSVLKYIPLNHTGHSAYPDIVLWGSWIVSHPYGLVRPSGLFSVLCPCPMFWPPRCVCSLHKSGLSFLFCAIPLLSRSSIPSPHHLPPPESSPSSSSRGTYACLSSILSRPCLWAEKLLLAASVIVNKTDVVSAIRGPC